MFILRLLLCGCKSAWLNIFVSRCSASLLEMCFYLLCSSHLCFRDTNPRNNQISITPLSCGLWFPVETALFIFSLSSLPSCTLKGEKSIQMNDKSQRFDGPGQREHSVRMAFHNDKEKAICSSRWVLYPLVVCNLKKVNYFFLVPLGIQEEAIYLIMSRHPAATKVVISLACYTESAWLTVKLIPS